MIKCIVCDLDGTLIKRDDTIEEKTYEALNEYIDQGIEFIIATGRDYNMVIDFLEAYQLDCDLILNNGTQYCNRDQSINELYPMDNHSFQKIAHILNDHGYLLAIHTDQGKYSFKDADEFWDYHLQLLLTSKQFPNQELPKKTFTTREGYLRDFHYAKSPEEMIKKNIKVLKIDARHLNASIQGIKQQLNIDYLDISSSFEENMEITTNVMNKGKMLRKVIEDKGYKPEEIAVFGDGENDCGMLEYFQCSFAPKNACLLAKQAAHYQLNKTVDEGAVYEGLEMLKQFNLL